MGEIVSAFQHRLVNRTKKSMLSKIWFGKFSLIKKVASYKNIIPRLVPITAH